MRDADAPDAAAGPRDRHRRLRGVLGADALQHAVDARAAGELHDALHGLLAALGDDVGGAQLARERRAVLVAAHDDDLLGAEALGGDHAAEPDGAVADDGHGVARA